MSAKRERGASPKQNFIPDRRFSMEPKTQLISVALPNGQPMQVETSVVDSLESTGFEVTIFSGVIGAIEGIALAVQVALAKVKSAKATVDLGLEIGVEAGQ
jgi:hypothetical protein